MRWFYNLKISTKLLISFLVVALITGVVGIFGIITIKTIDVKDTELYENMTVPISQLAAISTAFQRVRVDTRDIILANTPEEIKAQEESIKQRRAEVEQNTVDFEKRIVSVEVREAYKQFLDTRKVYIPYLDRLIQLAHENKDIEAFALINGEMAKAAAAEQQAIEKLVSMKIEDAKEKSDNNTSTANTATVVMLVFVAAGTILAIIFGLFISRIISNPIKVMVHAANKLAVGDIDVNVEATTTDEVGSLMESFSRMITNIREQAIAVGKIADGDLTTQVKVKSEQDLLGKKLCEMIERNNEVLGNINSAAVQVAAGSKQVSSSSQILSQGSTEQASSIEEITASIEQIAAQTKQNAVNASQANEFASTAKDKAVNGNTQMKEMLKAMQDINESSTSISKIIKVIDEIAFQTNILALNAAVEAARAGQHGKGFAVVAEEVRNLAARSANAAKETTTMIEGSIIKVEAGTKIANNTAFALNEIVEGIAKAANLVNDISIASNEQASGIAQVNQAITQVAQVVQTNSATSEEGAAASEELSSQSEFLKDLVSRYKLKKRGNNNGAALSSDVIKMLEEIAEKKTTPYLAENGLEKPVHKLKISLDDREFGKY